MRYNPDRGFYHARDVSGQQYLMLDSQVPSNIPGRMDSLIESLEHFDCAFETRWLRSSFMDPIWTTPLPPGHCLNQATGRRDPQLRDRYNSRQDEGQYSRTAGARFSRREEGPRDAGRRYDSRYVQDDHRRNTRLLLGQGRLRNPDFNNTRPPME